jgi:hypothetical protein
MANLYDYAGWGSSVTIARNPPPTMEGGPDGRFSEITFQIKPLSQLGPFLTFLQGELETVPIVGGTITRRVPLIHPDDVEQYIDSYRVDYFGRAMAELWEPGKSVHTEQYSFVKLRAFFRTLPPGIGPDQQYYTISDETGADVQTIPGGAMKTESNRVLTGERGIVIPCTSLVVTTFMSPNPISYAIRSIVGRVNSTPFTDGSDSYPTGTMRFESVRQERSVGSSGSILTKSFAVKMRDEPWNKVMNDIGVWENAYAVSGGATKYKTADLNILKSS